MIKNQATIIPFSAVDADTGNPVSAISSCVSRVSQNSGTWVTTTNTPVADSVTGIFHIRLTATEMNSDVVQLYITGSNIDPVHVIITPDQASLLTTDDISTIKSGLAQQSTVSSIANTVSTINAYTQRIPANPASSADIPNATTIATACLTFDLNSLAVGAPVYSQYTTIMAALKSKVVVAENSATGYWQIYNPANTLHTSFTVKTSETAKPIVEVN